MRSERIPTEVAESAILSALALGPASFTPLLHRMRQAGYPEGFTADGKATKILSALHKAGKIRLRRVCTFAQRTQTWEIVA